ncbi:MAG: hypothetical protein E6G56_13135 [Actinobacteria bacterium]|nr:MAG: hypothetical protein E6G56_13135 [Actinomycetota bacterium]
MRKTVLLAALAALGALMLVVPAQARKHHRPPKPHKPAVHKPAKRHKPAVHKPAKPHKPAEPHRCVPHAVGYNARGTLVSSALTPSGKGRYSGTLVVNVTKANHRAPTGTQTFTLTNAKVKFHGVTPPGTAGDRVGLHGKITRLAKKCGSFTPTITIKKVDINRPKRS